MTLQKQKKLDEENERVNRVREQLRCEDERRPKVKKEVPAEVKVRRLLNRSMNRWGKSHGMELVHDVLREVVGELGEE